LIFNKPILLNFGSDEPRSQFGRLSRSNIRWIAGGKVSGEQIAKPAERLDLVYEYRKEVFHSNRGDYLFCTNIIFIIYKEKKMKKIFAVLFVLGFVLATPFTVYAVKPDSNNAGAMEVGWNLSGAVMPVPPWGLSDIPGSDTASKLIVNQPSGNTEATVTGVMNGLAPNTTYTVYPSKGWSTSEKWNIEGDWNLSLLFDGTDYPHNMSVTFQNMSNGTFSGTGYYVDNPGYTWDIQGTSIVSGNTIHLDFIYTGLNPDYTVSALSNIDANGYFVDGTCTTSASQTCTWTSIGGKAEKETVGNGFPGLFGSLQTFTFTTDEFGSASWHFNLKNADFPGANTYALSIWINESGRTILISDVFEVVVE
jgi:hypothetical protein